MERENFYETSSYCAAISSKTAWVVFLLKKKVDILARFHFVGGNSMLENFSAMAAQELYIPIVNPNHRPLP